VRSRASLRASLLDGPARQAGRGCPRSPSVGVPLTSASSGAEVLASLMWCEPAETVIELGDRLRAAARRSRERSAGA
jgi:hypothetical protein